jgi:Bifunctional DNA primase/polymerase, N-terminal
VNTGAVLNGSIAPDPYGVVVERIGDRKYVVEYNGLDADDFLSRALKNLEHGYGCVPIGRVDPHRPDLPPHKVAWCRGYHGYDARDANASEITAMPFRIIRRLALRGERGILNLGARLAAGIVGIDVDGYGGKPGLATIAEHDCRLGPRKPTYFVTARGFDSGSGIYLYRTPDDWTGIGVLGGGVETIQSHLRYLAAPGSIHHTGETYQLFHQSLGPRPLGFVLPAPADPALASLPRPWVDALHRRPRTRGALATSEDIAAFAREYNFNEHPEMLDATVRAVAAATCEGQTRNAIHRALWIAARKARAGCYPWMFAVERIRTAAVAAYAHRGRDLDPFEFARSVDHAITKALDMAPVEVAAWGAQSLQFANGFRIRAARPARPRSPRVWVR